MDERMWLYSFVGVVLIGLTFVAYRSPNVYRRITIGLIPTMLCLVFASVGWNFGQFSAYHSLVPHIPSDIGMIFMTSFLDAFDEKCVYDAAMLIVIAYLFFLGYLAYFLRSKETLSPAR